MAPGPDEGLYVSIPRPGGSVLVLLDRDGRPSPGWPIAIGQSNACGLLLPVGDGSVRLACTLDNQQPGDAALWVFAFDARGRSMAGWPVNLGAVSQSGARGGYVGRMIGDSLTILTEVPTSPDGAAKEVWITSINVDGVPRQGARAAITASVPPGPVGQSDSRFGPPDEWAIGPDGVAYGTIHAIVDASTAAEYDAKAKSALFAVGSGGVAAGFPIAITGSASRPAFDAAGRVHLLVGSTRQPPARTLVFDTAGQVAIGGSDALDVTAPPECFMPEWSCPVPAPPLVGGDATTFVVAGSTVIAIGPSGQPLAAGWPYRSDAGPQVTFICRPGWACDSTDFAAPAIGPGNVLYLLQSATGPSGFGSIVAIGPDGHVRAGWPRTLKRAGAGFWSVVVGADGTAFALAIEPESVGYSATVLAIAPDSTVRYATTIVEP
jgi:hypothetical protein